MSIMTHDLAADRVAEVKSARDKKLAVVLQGQLPAWIVGEQASPVKSNCLFDVVFRAGGRWVQRRYDYDAEVDVLHFRGETLFDETQLHTLLRDMLFQPSA